MRIECKDTKEFIELMRACEYLHEIWDPHVEFPPILNFLMHLYLGEKDFPDKEKHISIKGRKTLPKRDETRWGAEIGALREKAGVPKANKKIPKTFKVNIRIHEAL